jgi:hypothetical protein
MTNIIISHYLELQTTRGRRHPHRVLFLYIYLGSKYYYFPIHNSSVGLLMKALCVLCKALYVI